MKFNSNNFNIAQIAESGQCFRMNSLAENHYNLVAYGRYLELKQIAAETVELSCSEEEFHLIWKDYFDLNYDYNKIVNDIMDDEDEFLKKAVEYGGGIRILKQESFEMMISFIISQNKNIPSIKNCIERICETYGDQKIDMKTGVTYCTFPEPKVLANAQKEDLRALKLGYRDAYIISAAQAVSNGAVNLSELMEYSHEEAVKIMKNIHGIGEKVANCISLYGLHHIEAFPVDVWINRVLSEVYDNSFDTNKYNGYAGIIQQYMFYYMRYLKNIKTA